MDHSYMWNCSGWHKTVSKADGVMQGCPLQLPSFVFFGLEWMTSSKEKNVRRTHLACSSASTRQQSKRANFCIHAGRAIPLSRGTKPHLHGKHAHCVFITWRLCFLRPTTFLSIYTTTSLHLMTTALTFQPSHRICTRWSVNSCRRQVHSQRQRAYVTR